MDYVGATSGRIFSLGHKLAEAGEAVIFVVQNQPTVLAKVFHNPPPDLAVRKFMALKDWKTKPAGVSFPVELLLDSATRRPMGLLIPYYRDAVPLAELLDPAGRAKLGLAGTPRELISLAIAVCRQVEAVHRARLVIGDLTPANILVGLKNGRLTEAVYVIDTNSFHVVCRSPKGTEVFLSGVATERYAAPEVQAADWATSDRTVWTDAYGLAVLLDQLLLEGSHPFDIITPAGEDPPPMGDRVRDGMWPYGPARPLPAGWRPVPTDPPFGSLPQAIQDLFRRTFHDGHGDDRKRATPADFVRELSAWEQTLRPTLGQRVVTLVGLNVTPSWSGGSWLRNVRVPGWAGLITAALLVAVLPTVWPGAASDAVPDVRSQTLVSVPLADVPPRRLPPADPTLFAPDLLGAFGVKESSREARR